MAESSSGEGTGGDNGGADLTPDSLAAADLTPDSVAAATPRATEPFGGASVPFIGLLGNDDDDAYVRVYQDYELRSYIRVPRESVRHRERVRNTNGVEVSMVFVDARAQVEIREVTSEQVQADLLSRALRAAESGAARGLSGSAMATPTITTITPPLTTLATRVFCTNFTCNCTARHSTLCSIACTDHPVCPNPWTENWFCSAA